MKRFIVCVLSLLMLFVGLAKAESVEDSLRILYAEGELLMAQGEYMEAAAKFDALGTYSDSSKMAMYCRAIAVAEDNDMFDAAIETFTVLGDFKDSSQMVIYYTARGKQMDGTVDLSASTDNALKDAIEDHQRAIELYDTVLLFKDSMTRIAACTDYIMSIETEQNRRQQEAIQAIYQEACELEKNGDYKKASELFDSISDYLDSSQRSETCANNHLYYEACSYVNEHEYVQAARIFVHLRGFKDVEELIQGNVDLSSAIKHEEQYLVGRYITLGKCKQTNSEDTTAISWLIVERDGNRALLLSQYALGVADDGDVDDWLDDFEKTAFSEEERKAICHVSLDYTKNPEYPGRFSVYGDEGPLFLLSCEEVIRYFSLIPGMTCIPTEYARTLCMNADYLLTLSNNAWMLRTAGADKFNSNTFCYYSNGNNYINYTGYSVLFLTEGLYVRPAMWVDLDHALFTQ